jgi:hypothetical protein
MGLRMALMRLGSDHSDRLIQNGRAGRTTELNQNGRIRAEQGASRTTGRAQ